VRVSTVLREALIAEFAKCCYSKGLCLTFDSVGKLIYLLQVLYNKVPIIYDYYLYEKNGPVGVGLEKDIKESVILNNIIIKDGEIEPDNNTLNAIKKGWIFLEKVRPHISDVLDRFGEITHKELDNISSVVYINKHIDEFVTEEDVDKNVFIESIMNEYSYVSHDEVQKAINYLLQWEHMERLV